MLFLISLGLGIIVGMFIGIIYERHRDRNYLHIFRKG